MGKALALKPEGQLDPMPQIRRVEGKTDSHTSCPLTQECYEWNHAQTYTKILHVTIKNQQTLLWSGRKISTKSHLITALEPRIQPNLADQQR